MRMLRDRRGQRSGTIARRLVYAMAGLSLGVVVTALSAAAYEGFGAATPGGAGGAVVRITTLASAGTGSLRAALAEGHRTIVFEVGGAIDLDDHLYVRGAFVTIDGFSAPPPGITLRHAGLIIRGSQGAHDVIVRGVRVRDSTVDGIQVADGAYNVVIDHVSIAGSADGNLDITGGAHDVTVSWSILASPQSRHSMLVKYHPERVSLHHNLIVNSPRQNPDVGIDTFGNPALDTTADVRNNLIWNWGPGFGTRIHSDARVNVISNLYSNAATSLNDQSQAIIVCTDNCPEEPASLTRVHVSGNVSANAPGFAINGASTDPEPFAASPVTTTDACLAARRVLAEAGVRALDAVDEANLAGITLPWCPAVFVKGLYHEALRRTPAADEVQGWLDYLGREPSPWTTWMAIRAFFDSAEARALPITPTGYVAALYRASHGRPPERDVLTLYTHQVLDRMNTLVPLVLQSPDFSAAEPLASGALVDRFYQEMLGRPPSAEESRAWIDFLEATRDVAAAARGLLTLEEYTARPRTLADHVRAVVRALLGREPTGAESAAWVDHLVGQLGTLSPRGEDVDAFVSRVAHLFS